MSFCRSAESVGETTADDRDAEGTPGYLPPEVLRMGCYPGWAGDSWALGCVTYFCLVGRPKYYGATFEEVMIYILYDSIRHCSYYYVVVFVGAEANSK